MEVIINNCAVKISGLSDIISYKKRLYQDIVNLKEELKDKESELKRVETYLKYNCKHNWIIDSIDQMKGYKRCVTIKYCSECELTIS